MNIGEFILTIGAVIIGVFIILGISRIVGLNTKVDIEELDYESKELKKAIKSYSEAYTIRQYERNGKSIYTKKGEYSKLIPMSSTKV